MDDIFIRLSEELKAHRPAVLLTIVGSSGSAPRGTGSRRLVLLSGSAVGTIGGGTAEYEADKAAHKSFHGQSSRLLTYDLDRDGGAGAVCGGCIDVFCQYIEEEALPCIDKIGMMQKDGKGFRLIYDLTEPAAWAMAAAAFGEEAVYCGDEKTKERLDAFLQKYPDFPQKKWAGMIEREGMRLYGEAVSAPSRVFIYGGGHIACALVPLLARIGFSCTVIDDRDEFVGSARFPDAVRTVAVPLDRLPDDLLPGRHDYACIMTRGHTYDYAVEKQILPRRPYYLGVIGSRAKLDFVRRKLRDDGFSDAELNGVYGPIGLPISAAAPEEIAVSIAAELIAVRAAKEGREKENARKWRSAHVPHLRIPER